MFQIRFLMLKTYKKWKIKLQHIRGWWQNKNPEQKWDFIIEIGNVPGELIGVRVFSDMKLCWYTGVTAAMIATYFLLNIYTIQYYVRRGEIVRSVEGLCVVGVVVGVRAFLHSNFIVIEWTTLICLCFNFSISRIWFCTGNQWDRIDSDLILFICFAVLISTNQTPNRCNINACASNTLQICWKLS